MIELRKRGFFVRHVALGKWDLSLYFQCDTYAALSRQFGDSAA